MYWILPWSIRPRLYVWEFLSEKRRTVLAALLFLTLFLFGGALICTYTRIDSNYLLHPFLLLALLLYLRTLRGSISVWRAVFSFCSGVFLLAICSVEAILICARTEADNAAPVCTPLTSLVSIGLALLLGGMYVLTAAPWLRWLLCAYESERIWRAIWLLPAGYTAL